MSCSYYCNGYCFWHGDTGEVCDKMEFGSRKRRNDGYCPAEENDRELEELAEAMMKADEEKINAERQAAMDAVNKVFVTGKFPDNAVEFAVLVQNGFRLYEEERRSLRNSLDFANDVNEYHRGVINARRKRLAPHLKQEIIAAAREALHTILAPRASSMGEDGRGFKLALDAVDALLADMLPKPQKGKRGG